MEFYPKVTFLIPCYNASEFIEDALKCVINQTYKNLEIILIDDGSIDNTFEILKKYELEDTRIKLIKNDKNIGLIKTLNIGIEYITGQYCARFDADDLIDLDRIEKQVKQITENENIDLVTSKAVYITENGKYFSDVDQNHNTLTNSIKFATLFESPFLHAGILLKTEILRKYKFSDNEESKHIEDFDLFSRLVFTGIRIKTDFNQTNVYKYRRNANSVSFKFREIQTENALMLAKRNLFDNVGIVADKQILSIINSNINSATKTNEIKTAIDFLDNVYLKYCNSNKFEISELELIEISNWLHFKKFKIYINSILFGNPKIKLYSLYSVTKTINFWRNKLVLNFISNKVIWLKSKIIYRT